jgi:putative hemolysin
MYAGLLSLLLVHLMVILPESTAIILSIFLASSVMMLFMNSGAEIAFFSIGYKDLNNLRSKKYPGSERILILLKEPKQLMSSMLVGNMVLRLLIVLLCNYLIREEYFPMVTGPFLFMLRFLIAIFILLLFGELLPKVWAANNQTRFAFYSSVFVAINYWLFRRPGKWFASITESLEQSLGVDSDMNSRLEQIDQAIGLSSSPDTSEDEKNILKGIAQFGNITVRRAMRSRLDVQGIDESLSFTELKKRVAEQQYSRYPVYKGSLDTIIGMIHSKDLLPHLNEDEHFNWKKLMRNPFFIHEQILIADLLKSFQTNRIHFAVVVDEFGGTDGIITMEDILEEIVGEIRDEYDEDEIVNVKIDEFNFIFEGKLMIFEACKIMKMPYKLFDEIRGESETMAGLVLELAGEIPTVGKEFYAKDFTFTIMETGQNRILKVKVSITPQIL